MEKGLTERPDILPELIEALKEADRTYRQTQEKEAWE